MRLIRNRQWFIKDDVRCIYCLKLTTIVQSQLLFLPLPLPSITITTTTTTTAAATNAATASAITTTAAATTSIGRLRTSTAILTLSTQIDNWVYERTTKQKKGTL